MVTKSLITDFICAKIHPLVQTTLLNLFPVSGIGMALAALCMLVAIVTDLLVDDHNTMSHAMSAQYILYGLSEAFYFPAGELSDRTI